MNIQDFIAVNTTIEPMKIDTEDAIRVVKSGKLYEYDENTYAKLKDADFHNGTIEVDMLSRLLPDAPDFARGFIGIAFRIAEDDSSFESFYIRPTNSVNATNDPVRQAHGCQYFSYPGYTFEYFRNNNITKYEAPIHNELNQWVHLKAVVEDAHAEFFLNNEESPTLVVDGLFRGASSRGAVGLFVDIGTEAFFKKLSIREKFI